MTDLIVSFADALDLIYETEQMISNGYDLKAAYANSCGAKEVIDNLTEEDLKHATTNDPVCKQFKSRNQSGVYEMNLKLHSVRIGDKGFANFYGIRSTNEEKTPLTDAMIYNINTTSSYRFTLYGGGTYAINCFFKESYFHTLMRDMDNGTLNSFLKNLRAVYINVFQITYPFMDKNQALIAANVAAVGVLKELKAPFTPLQVSEALNVTPIIAEDIIDKYTPSSDENDEGTIDGLGWMI